MFLRSTAVILVLGSWPSNCATEKREALSPVSEASAGRPNGKPEAQRAAKLAAAAAATEAREKRLAFEKQFPNYGVALHYVTQVFREPNLKSPIAGYMRRGAVFRTGEAVAGGGCKGGFHALPPGGYVCASRGVKVGKAPQFFDRAPLAPTLESALPYPYARTVYKATAQYWRLPTRQEEGEAKQALASLIEEEEKLLEQQAAAAASDAGGDNAEGSEADGADAEGGAATTDAVDAPPPPGLEEEEESPTVEGASEELASTLPDYVRMPMRRGYYVSLDHTELTEDGRRFSKTIRGGYVPTHTLVPVEPPSLRGVVLGGSWKLPLAFVFRPGARGLIMDADGSLRSLGTLDRHTPMVLQEQIDRGKRHYIRGLDGTIVRRGSVRVVPQVARPPVVPEDARWVHIRLSTQTLVAYEGSRAVFATTVSSGLEDHATPTGVFQIQSKHISTTMDDDTSPETAYSIEDVPYTMYFHHNYAMHGAFWHNRFGQVVSHGCVNLAPVDARWLFQWSEPQVPAGWHGVFRGTGEGTWVYIDE